MRPAKGANPFAIPSFFGAWLTSELAPQNLGVTVAGSVAYVAGRRGRLSRGDRIALGLNAASAAGLAVMLRQGMQARGARGQRTQDRPVNAGKRGTSVVQGLVDAALAFVILSGVFCHSATSRQLSW